jgi:ABC-type bacteriocin/lantibiotic exporter with double-glycine peptidase domain
MKKNREALILLSLAFLLVSATGSLFLATHDSDVIRRTAAWWTGGEFLGTEGVLFQRSTMDCGPTALKMVLDHFGIQSSLNELSSLAHQTTRGTSMLTLKGIAERKGLHVEGWHFTFDDFQKAPLPALVWVHRAHFVVVTHISADGRVEALDPSLGHLRYSRSDFQKIWGGDTLVFTPRYPSRQPSQANRESRLP